MVNENQDAAINHELINRISGFINEIGIECKPGELPATTFLPGVEIQNGSIIYDTGKLAYPGDLLHEAGHLAVLHPQHRPMANGSDNLAGDLDAAAAEMAAIAWSWACREHLGIPPEALFHSGGYKDGSDSLIVAFSKSNEGGVIPGVPMLQYLGMARELKPYAIPEEFTFPKMKHWLRQG